MVLRGAELQRAECLPVIAAEGQVQMPDLVDRLARCHLLADGATQKAEAAVFIDGRARPGEPPALLAGEPTCEVQTVRGALERMGLQPRPECGLFAGPDGRFGQGGSGFQLGKS